MINALEGIPGGGKSYEAVAFHILPALEQGRKVITNLPLNLEALGAINAEWPALVERRTSPRPVLGTWDAEREQAFQLYPQPRPVRDDEPPQQPEPAKHAGRVFGGVWDYYDQWRHPKTGQGALFVVDECHVAMPKIGTPAEVVQWFKLHRHFNADVLLLTQSFRDLSAEISGLIHFLHKVRQADLLGKPGYIKKVHAGYRGGVVSTQERQYDSKFFGLYRSHTQGNAVGGTIASDVKSSLVGWRRMSWALYAVIAVVTVWAWWPQDEKPKRPKERPVSERMKPGGDLQWLHDADCGEGMRVLDGECVPRAPAAAKPAIQAQQTLAIGEVQYAADVEPLHGKRVHVTGSMSMRGRVIHTFALSQGGQRYADVTSDDLKAAGYTYEHLAPCMGRLRFGPATYPVSCDAPHLAAGTERAPVVVALPGTGSGSAVVADAGQQPHIAPWMGGHPNH